MPAQLAETQQHLAFISAVLGGFSFTFFIAVLAGGGKGRLTGAVAGLASASALCFLLATSCGALGLPLAIQASPTTSAAHELLTGVTGIAFSAGMMLLVASVGAAGWLRSRLLGLLASCLATLVLALMAYGAWMLLS